MLVRSTLRPLTRLLTIVALAIPHAAVAQTTTDVIFEWNRILVTALTVPGASPATVFVTRPTAMMHEAIFDALNSIDPVYVPYLTGVTAPSGASRDAAVAQAAHDVLAAIMPSQLAVYDAALATTLGRIDRTAGAAGAAVGAAAARAIVTSRADDGWNRPAAPYVLPNLPGYWQPTPPANAAAGFVQYQDVRGFIVPSARMLLVGPPPDLTSARYATDFNEVKSIGAVNSTTRTADETQIANVWASVGNITTPIAAWNSAMQDLAQRQNLNALDTARMFALTNMTMHDALYVSFTGKFNYGLWRPVTAIREAARDNNPATAADPTWLSLVTTPPYPSYPGNMTCIGASAASLLAKLLGRDNVPFTMSWSVANGPSISRSYNGLRQAADEEARSRVLAGIHFTFDNQASFGVCTILGEYAAANYLRKR